MTLKTHQLNNHKHIAATILQSLEWWRLCVLGRLATKHCPAISLVAAKHITPTFPLEQGWGEVGTKVDQRWVDSGFSKGKSALRSLSGVCLFVCLSAILSLNSLNAMFHKFCKTFHVLNLLQKRPVICQNQFFLRYLQ